MRSRLTRTTLTKVDKKREIDLRDGIGTRLAASGQRYEEGDGLAMSIVMVGAVGMLSLGLGLALSFVSLRAVLRLLEAQKS